MLDASTPEAVEPTSQASGVDDDRADLELLHRISVELIGEQDLDQLYGKIVDAAVAIMGSQFGTMQLVCPPGDPSGHAGDLKLLGFHGLPPEAIAFWQWVSPTVQTSCTMALRCEQRAIIADYEQWGQIAGTPDLIAFRQAGIRAAQTTPLVSRTGKVLGMISTHWSYVHQPSARDLRLLDILARLAADLLDRTIAEQALRSREAELRHAETELLLLNETLETQVQQRTRELLAAENQVRQMQKLEAIGQLTGGVAHDFNNLLTIIRSSVELLRRPALTEEKRARYLDAIATTGDRAAKLTSQLLSFARRQALKPVIFDACDRVHDVAEMLRTIVGSRIYLVVDPCLTLCTVEADLSQFETALVNLVVNARDAMHGEGELVIHARSVSALPPLRGHTGFDGPFVAISVADTGGGIAEETLGRIFEPFFTTKEVGKGTGLGLSQVFGFAKQSGGDVDVQSALGQGTKFTLYLPSVEPLGSPPPRESAETLDDERGSVLIVEDNVEVGEFARQLLDDLGFTTSLVGNGQSALAVLEQHAAEFDYVFSDVVMPGISGLELARRIRARWPGLPVVLTSGYSQVLAEDAQHGFALLQKPYSVGELGQMLRIARETASNTKP